MDRISLDQADIEQIDEQAEILTDLAPAQQFAWVSSLMALYGQAAIEKAAVSGSGSSFKSDIIRSAVAVLLADSVSEAAPVGSVCAGSSIVTRHGTSLVLHCQSVNAAPEKVDADLTVGELALDDTRYAILIDISKESGQITNIEVTDDFFEEAFRVDSDVEIVGHGLDEVLSRVMDGWRRSVDGFDESSQAGANMFFLRAHLRSAGLQADALALERVELDTKRGLGEAELAEANRWGVGILRAALGDDRIDVETEPGYSEAIEELFYGSVGALTTRQRQGLLWLEWADWLGFVIGVGRAKPGTVLDGSKAIDLVNRCPELSSDIPAADREYAGWVFEIILQRFEEISLIENGEVTEKTRRILPAALASVWDSSPSATL